ncbi:MAG TPA: discoidin domain-containing protein, partial [Thermoleophilaceae bacterium]|nr:discoidin domain-containing protein [Thermoleophilaceae bacterium]
MKLDSLTKRRALALAFAVTAILCFAAPAGAVTYPAGFEERPLATGLTGPVGLTFTPDGRMLVVEKAGRLKVVPPGGGPATTILDMTTRVNSYWDRGLLGIAVDSDYATNNYIYLLYTYDLNPLTPDGTGPAISRLSRFELSAANQVTNETVLLGTYSGGACPAPSNSIDCIPSEGASHSIGTVRSAPDGTLYVGSGDASSFSAVDTLAFRTYDERSMAGKIMHVDRNGRGLPGHPFCPAETNLDLVCTKLYAKGFRNPFRFQLRQNGGIHVGDVGWDTREEMDIIPSGGRSYGWPCYEGTIRTPGYRDRAECTTEYAKEGTANAHVGPVYDYGHVGSSAIVAGPAYAGTLYPPGYRDAIFFGDYAQGFIKKLRLNPDGSVAGVDSFATGWTGTAVEAAPNGDIVYAGFGDGSPGTGSIQRIVYSPGNSSPVAHAAANPESGSPPLAVQFSSAGSADSDGDPLSYSWDFGDGATSTAANPSHTYTASGVFTATLTVSDGRGLSATDSVQVSTRGAGPTATITSPADESLYRDGDTITLRGSATDPQDGTLPASALSWNVIIHHASHIHQVGTFDGTDTASFQTLRDHDADSYYEITLRATDSSGLVGRRMIQIRPETVPFSLRSTPTGAPLSYSADAVSAPFDTDAAIGFNTTVSAAQQFTSGTTPYWFDSWSNGGSRTQNLTVPAQATTLTARYLENKAFGRAATASSSEPGFTPSAAVDGDPSTRWSSAAADDQWWQVDLGAARDVSAVELDWENAYASSYEILTSLDGVNFSSAAQQALIAPGTQRTSFATRSARYVRVRALQRATMFGVSFFEARVLGPADPPPPILDLALNRPASASSTNASAGPPSSANDGDTTTRWSSNFADAQWWQVDLGSVKKVERVEVNWEAAFASTYRIQTSTDGTTFTTAASVTRNSAGLAATTFTARDARYVRLVGDTRATPYGISFWDFRVFGPDGAPPPPDTTPPDTTIDSGPSGTTTATSASFGFSSTESASTFECRIDGGPWGTCTSPKSYSGLSAAAHTFDVRAIDLAGNVDPTPASRTWTVTSTTDPDLALNMPATASSTDISAGPPSAANDGNSATRWSSTYADAQWWQVDLGSVKSIERVEVNWEAAYASAYRIQTSTDGTTFTTAASVTRGAGGLAITTFTARNARYVRLVADTRATPYGISFWDFRVYAPAGAPPPPDTTPPDTAIDPASGPTGTTTSTSASFDFSSSETNSTFECRLDGGAWTACTSPRSYSGLSTGGHSFDVRATDAAGNTDATPAGRTWTVAAPSTDDLALGRPATASSTDPSAGAPSAANDGNSSTRWSSSYLDGQWWQVDLGSVQTIERVEVNWEAAYASTYRIQTSTDGASFTTAASVTRNAAGLATTTFTARDARYVRLVGDTRATPYGISFWDLRVYAPTGAPPPPDTTPPDTAIDPSSGPTGTTTSTSAAFTFSSTEPGSTFECRIDGGAWGGCTSPKSYSGLSAAAHTFDVRATDAAGNTDPTPATRTWTISPPAAYSAVVGSTAGMVNWWRLGDSGTSAADSKGTNTGAYVNGPVSVASLLGSDTANAARDFDGVNDYVNLAPAGFGTPAQLSVEAWVRID